MKNRKPETVNVRLSLKLAQRIEADGELRGIGWKAKDAFFDALYSAIRRKEKHEEDN